MKSAFRPPQMDVNSAGAATLAFKERLAEMADPAREFRRHLIMKFDGEPEDIEMSARMNQIYQDSRDSLRKPINT